MPNQPTLDIDFVRSCFPAFKEELPASTAFFENAGGSYTVGPVIDRLCHFYRANKVQPYGESRLGKAAGMQMDAGRQAISELLGVDSTTITLGPSTTQNINTLSIACTSLISEHNEIIVTEQDHEANIGGWMRLCARTKAKLVIWPINADTAELEIKDFVALLNPAVRLVCMTHSSNIVGTINPVEEVIKLSHQNGSYVIVDGVSFAPHQWPDIAKLKADVYCFSTYKTYATHLGVMVTDPDFSQQLEPQCHNFNQHIKHMRLDAAGPDHASIAALAGLTEYFDQLYCHHFVQSDITLYEKSRQMATLMHAHEVALCQRLLAAINTMQLQVIGRTQIDGREANLALLANKYSTKEMAQILSQHDIAVGHGNFYAQRLLRKMGVTDLEDGVLRISLAHYNTIDEVDRLIKVLEKLA